MRLGSLLYFLFSSGGATTSGGWGRCECAWVGRTFGAFTCVSSESSLPSLCVFFPARGNGTQSVCPTGFAVSLLLSPIPTAASQEPPPELRRGVHRRPRHRPPPAPPLPPPHLAVPQHQQVSPLCPEFPSPLPPTEGRRWFLAAISFREKIRCPCCITASEELPG